MAKFLDKISDKDIVKQDISKGISLVYVLDNELEPFRHYHPGVQGQLPKQGQRSKCKA